MKKSIIILTAFFWTMGSNAQTDKIVVTGSVQSDVLIPQNDEAIGTEETSDWALTNTYVEAALQSKYIDAGARFEFLEHPLPGFEKDFQGWGVPYFYLKGRPAKNLELTAGHFYEQFGSGFVLRTYEERSLGIDNSLLGGRVVYKPVEGVQLKAITGKQRRYWSYNKAWVTGGDIELNIDKWIRALADGNTYVTLGASFVNKHEKASDDAIFVTPVHQLNLPENVNAWDVRASVSHGGWNVLAEYAQKTQDPSFDNGYIYRKGYVAMLSTSYSKRGLSLLLQAKRSDNMSFRSRRSMNGTSSFLNHLPAFTMEHTYALAAMYPYATHPEGEWAYQAELGYTFKKNTVLGGKYGTGVQVNFSHVHAIDQNPHSMQVEPYLIKGAGSDGYGSAFWKWGDQTYYQDLNIQIDKRISRDFKLNLMYMNQRYNKTIVEGEGGMIHSDIFVAEGKYKMNKKLTLRGELQYLTTKQDQGDWAFALLELSWLPNWMFTISDQWNCGETNLHYYQGLVTYHLGSHRIQAGYGRTRAGYNCSGGVCRYVPASKGFMLSYNYNF